MVVSLGQVGTETGGKETGLKALSCNTIGMFWFLRLLSSGFSPKKRGPKRTSYYAVYQILTLYRGLPQALSATRWK